MDQLLPKSGRSVFRLARLVMHRALEIHFGSPPLVDHLPSEKEATIAMREIDQDKIVIKDKKQAKENTAEKTKKKGE